VKTLVRLCVALIVLVLFVTLGAAALSIVARLFLHA
jgi:hypothetical protein